MNIRSSSITINCAKPVGIFKTGTEQAAYLIFKERKEEDVENETQKTVFQIARSADVTGNGIDADTGHGNGGRRRWGQHDHDKWYRAK